MSKQTYNQIEVDDFLKEYTLNLFETLEKGYNVCMELIYETGRSPCKFQEDDECNNSCRFMSDNCKWYKVFKQGYINDK